MTKQEAKSRAARDGFMGAAFQVLCERGYGGASLDDIIDRSGRSKGAFYHHFESKEDLFRQLFEDMIEMIEASTLNMKSALNEGRTLREAVLTSFEANQKFLNSKLRMRSLVELYFVGMRDPWVKKLLRRLQIRIVEMFTEALVLAMEQGKIRKLKNPRQVAELLHQGNRGVLFMEIILNDGKNLRSKIIRWLDFQLAALSVD